MTIFEIIESYAPYVFPPVFGAIITIVIIGFLRKSKDWKRIEKKYNVQPNEFKKLGVLHQLRFDGLPYKNMFGLGLNNKGIILYPAIINELTHKPILIPYNQIEEIETEIYKLNLITYKKLKIYLPQESMTLIMSEYMAKNILNIYKKITAQQTEQNEG